MSSLYEELTRKVAADPRLTKRGGARADLGLLLFNAHAELNALWQAAERCARDGDHAPDDLCAAVEGLRPIFGERAAASG